MTKMNKKQVKQAKETVDVLEHGFTTQKLLHKGYTEIEQAREKLGEYWDKEKTIKIKHHFGKWQYIFKQGNRQISLIKIDVGRINDDTPHFVWEMYANNDKSLFEDIQRFETKELAMKAIEGHFNK